MFFPSRATLFSRFLLSVPFLCGAISIAVAQEDFREVVHAATPGVVTIMVFDSTGRPTGQGSGFFVDAEHIITCRHVIEGADRAEFRVSSGTIFAVEGVSADDPLTDLASLYVRVPKDVAHGLRLATSPVEIGEAVLAIGSPLGFELTVSSGIVSSRRTLPDVGPMLQITAPLSSGSSGGPVLNNRGEVVGVATSVVDKGQNLNFATPVEGIRALKVRPPQSIKAWSRLQREHPPTDGLPPEMVALMRDSAQATFLSDYAFERGRAFMAERNLEQAVQMFITAAGLQPMRADAYYQAGMCELMMRHPEHALEAFQRGVRAAPTHVSMWFQLGRMQVAVKKLKEGAVSLQEALRLDSTYAPAWYELGETYYAMQNDTAAIRCLKQSLRLNPDNFDAHMGLGALLADRRDFNGAGTEFFEAFKLDPASPLAKGSLGSVYNKLGRFKDALPLLDSAVAAIPNDADLRSEFGVALLNLNRCADAQRELGISIRLNPENAPTHYNLGNVYLCLKKGNDAIEEFTEAIRLDPDNPLPHYSLGMTYATVKRDKGKALEEYKILRALDPDAARLLFNAIYGK